MAGGEKAGLPPARVENNVERLLRRLEWTVLRRLEGVLQGDYRTLFRGFGMDFADLHEYQAEDDVRYIDWNVTARLQVPHVREFQEDREVAAWFLVDLSGSLDFGSQTVAKRMLSAELVAVLARLLTRRGFLPLFTVTPRVGIIAPTGHTAPIHRPPIVPVIVHFELPGDGLVSVKGGTVLNLLFGQLDFDGLLFFIQGPQRMRGDQHLPAREPASCFCDEITDGPVPVIEIEFFDLPNFPVAAVQLITL